MNFKHQQGKMFVYSGARSRGGTSGDEENTAAASDNISFVFVEEPEIPVLKGRGLLCCASAKESTIGILHASVQSLFPLSKLARYDCRTLIIFIGCSFFALSLR